MKRFIDPITSAFLLLFSFYGCVTLERGYPEKRYFVLEASQPATAANPARERILMVANLRVSPRYADKNFVYRLSESGYETDFYHQFLTATDIMVGEEVRRGLSAAQAFKYVIGPSNPLRPDLVLEGSVNALYGDFRNLAAPRAMMEIEFFLHNEDTTKAGIVLHKRYTHSVVIEGRSADALVKGWNGSLNEILAALIADLRAVKF